MFGRLKFFFKRLKSLRVEPEFRRARLWTNIELKKIAHNFTGTVINVSGWADEDKCGAVYRDYFVNAEEYFVSNLGGGAQKRMQKILPDSIPIDLSQPIESKHFQAYDCVFSHTVLEHVFNIFQAVKNLCDMSRELIIVIVPFVQRVHFQPGSFLDFWRFTPFCIEQIFGLSGFEPVYRKGINIPGTSLYYFYVFSKKNSEKWLALFGPIERLENLPKGEDIYTIDRLKGYLKYVWFRQKKFD